MVSHPGVFSPTAPTLTDEKNSYASLPYSQEKELDPRYAEAPEFAHANHAPQLAFDQDSSTHKVAVNGEYRDSEYPETVYARYASPPYGQVPGYEMRRPELGGQEQENGQPRVKRKKKWIILAIVLLVLLGAGLGAGLGIGLRSKDSSTNAGSSGQTGSSSQADPNSNSNSSSNSTTAQASTAVLERTGIAMTARGDGAGTLLYYQAPNGSLIENFFETSALQDLDSSNLTWRATTQSTIPTPGIISQTPLTAASYTFSGETFRHLFYTNSQGQILETRATSSSSSWSSPTPVLNETYFGPVLISGSSPGLQACHSPSLPTLFLFYANQKGFFDLLSRPHSNPSNWSSEQIFPLADKFAGGACDVTVSTNDTATTSTISVFYGNFSSDSIVHWAQQRTRDPDGAPSWTRVPEEVVATNPLSTMASYGDMALATGTEGEKTLFYGGTAEEVRQVGYGAGEPTGASGVASWEPGRIVRGSKMAAGIVGNQVLLVYQSAAEALSVGRPNRNGALMGNGTLTIIT
ncbi:hypothetical protein CAC42_4353 [Sphaceloma murrayae]|uniref:Fucose-specific lectin n=1 Tax=Sphaceloma murrayae TaxID=2082308 RepID=A0A2K1QLY4_9PEZI|nr:hypothetical protein CAC42_4353 [Sphaceloma murrayae]